MVDLRPATTAGAHAIARLNERADAGRLGRPLPDTPFGATVGEWLRRLSDRDQRSLVALEDGAIVGSAFAGPAREDAGRGAVIPRLAHVSGVAVEPAFWRRGIGRLLVSTLCDGLRGRYAVAQLWTQLDNVRARGLYESLGWRDSGDRLTEREAMLRYVLDLGEG